MRIADKIASEILDKLEANVNGLFEIKAEEYFNIECLIADTIKEELQKWLDYDVDLNQHSNEVI